MAHRKSTLAVFIALSALIAAACSSSATVAPAGNGGTGDGTGAGASAAAGGGPLASLLGGLGALSGGKDPSTLLTSDAAAAILGGPVTAVPGAATPISASYATASGDSVSIFIEALPGTVSAAVLQGALAQANADGTLQTINGLGDVAGKEVSDTSATVGFDKGGTLIIINAESATQKGSDMEPKIEALAQQISGSL